MALRRFLGGSSGRGDDHSTTAAGRDGAETETVRRIVGQLEALEPERARHLAGFALILGRTADADSVITEAETRLMEEIVHEHGGIPEAQAILVVEIAKQQERLSGGTDDYIVTREWAEAATEEERLALFHCCFLVGAIDDSISAEESAVLNEIGRELQLDPVTINKIRAEFTDRFEAVREMRAADGRS